MAEKKKGTSADAEVPEEHQEGEEIAEAAAEQPLAEAPADHAAEEAPPEEAPAAEAGAPAADATEELATAAEAATDVDAPGTSASAAVPAEPKRKKKRLPRTLRPQKTRPRRVKPTERKPIVRIEKPEHERGRRQERQGTVVSDAMEKTIVVRVDVVKAHPKYKKVVRRSVKFHAHDETGQAKVGDVVRIVETRPLSKTKRWRLAEVLEVAK